MPAESADTDLLIESRSRPELFGVLYERHAATVYRYLARRVGPAAAEDLLADVFVAALGARMRVIPHASGSALPWLYGIAGNVVRSHFRRSGSRALLEGSTVVDWDAVDARLDAESLGGHLHTALGTLTPAELELLLLVAWEELSPSEAAAVLGISPVAARSRLHRARNHAQSALDALTRTNR